MSISLDAKTTALAVAILDVLDAAGRPLTATEVRMAVGRERATSTTVRASLGGLLRTGEAVRSHHPENPKIAVYSTDIKE